MRMIFLQIPLSVRAAKQRSNLLANAGIALFTLAMAILMTSCATIDAYFAIPTSSPPAETATSTPTIVWFPPSVTPSPQSLRTPTPIPNLKPNLGEVIFEDDFSAPELWDIAASDQASASINQNRLNLAAQSNIYMMSLRRETILDNFYAEITAFPGLCRDNDSYGLLVRANAVAYYRFNLSCNGFISAERVSGKSRVWLQEPMPSGDVPFGAGKVRMGVWAFGKEMRLFLNERYQFGVTNSNYPAGSIGVFVNSAGATPVVVSFSDLSVREVK